MSEDSKNSRRSFLKKLAFGAAALPILATVDLGNTKAFAQATPDKPLDENDTMAKTMGYHIDGSKVDVVAFPKKAGPDGSKQMCKNCVLYLEGGKTIAGQTGEWGKCGLFQNGLVNAAGWCNSYAQKVA